MTMGDWDAGAGTGVTGATGATYVSSVGGMAGTSGLYSTDGGVNGRQVALTAIRVCGAAAGGMATFASGPTCGAGAIAAGALGMITTAVEGGFSAYDAQKTKATLIELRKKAEVARGTQQERDALIEVLDGCIGKATNKFNYGVANATGVAQIGVAATRTGRAIYKAATRQKGVGRARRADYLYELAKGSSSLSVIARKAIEAICMENFEKFMKASIADAMKS